MALTSKVSRCVAAAFCCICVSVPLLAVQFPPVTDLPQQVAQIRLLIESLHDEANHGKYTIQWTKSGNASYLLLGGAWALFGPEYAGRVFLLFAVLSWVLSAHIYAGKLSRPLAGCILASILVYNLSLYWGLLSFMLGFPCFLLLAYVFKAYSVRTLQGAFLWTTGALLLYSSHVLWLIFAIVYVVLCSLVRKESYSDLLLKLAYFSPFALLAVSWSIKLYDSSMDSVSEWYLTPFVERLDPGVIARAILGSSVGVTKYVCAGVIAAYIAAIVVFRRRDFWKAVDKELLLASFMLLLAAQVLPDKEMGTFFFASRWLAPGMALLLLALPGIPFKSSLVEVSLCGIVCLYCIMTTAVWTQFERKYMTGLVQAIQALPKYPSVFGVNASSSNSEILGRPLLHSYAYAQAFKGGKLNFSFADFPSSLVTFRQGKFNSFWELHWNLRQLPPMSLLTDYDYALVGNEGAYHRYLESNSHFQALTHSGYWRLYKILHN